MDPFHYFNTFSPISNAEEAVLDDLEILAGHCINDLQARLDTQTQAQAPTAAATVPSAAAAPSTAATDQAMQVQSTPDQAMLDQSTSTQDLTQAALVFNRDPRIDPMISGMETQASGEQS